MSEPVDVGALLKAAGQKRRAAQRAAAPPSAPLVAVNGHGDPYAMAALRGEASEVAAAGEGTRNHTLNKAWFNMGRHVGAGTIGVDVVRQTLAAAARGTGLSEAEISLVLRDDETSAVKAGQAVPRIPDAGFGANVSEVDASEFGVVEVPRDLEAAFWDARPVLTHLQTFARARRVSPWGVLGCALARVVVSVPWTVTLPPIIGGVGSLNLFVGLVGASGDGKGACEAVAADALHVDPIRSARIASGEAIAHVYKRKDKDNPNGEWRDESHAAIILVPEIDRLAGQAGRQGSTIMADLRSAWTGELLGQVAADSTRSIPLEAHQYRLALVAGIQPQRAGCLLDDADGGTPQRFLWFPVSDTEAPEHPPAEPRPVRWSAPMVPQTGFVGRQVEVCETARQEITDARLARLRGVGDALDGHVYLARLKTAAALALLDGRAAVEDEDWTLAGIVAEKSMATRSQVVAALAYRKQVESEKRATAEAYRATTVADSLEEAAVHRVGRAIRRRLERSEEWVTVSAVRKSISARDRQHFDAGLEDLLRVQQVEVDDEGRGQRLRLVR